MALRLLYSNRAGAFQGIFHLQILIVKINKPKRDSTSKCDVGNWIFSKSWEFLGIFWVFFGKLFGNSLEIDLFVKIWVFVNILIFRSGRGKLIALKKVRES